jgi:hypothetical protein
MIDLLLPLSIQRGRFLHLLNGFGKAVLGEQCVGM